MAFEEAERFESDTAIEARDDRRSYPEVRTMAVGFIGHRLHVMIFTRRGSSLRLISLRRAYRREIRRYAEF